ncbi:MAG: hypothetical protein WBS24_08735 [Terriglobales bacterium]
MKQDLINPDLFGNDAGEDEHPEVLNSYFFEKPEFLSFFNPDRRLGFVRSRKGMGKSALLREALYRRKLSNEGELLLYVKASDLIALQVVDISSPAALVHGWQQRMCSRINLELGSTLRFAVSDDATSLVEGAEVTGFRGRNLIGALLDRLKIKAAGFELSRERVGIGDSQALLRRFSENKDIKAWLYVDDVDATFLNTDAERLKVSTFFSACRNLANTVEGLNIRASVRTDVWSILKQYDEALDKCEQYMLDLKWSTEDSGRIIEKKIAAFYLRTYGKIPAARYTTNLVFQEPFPWGRRRLAAFRPIHILSAGRPRWATQLCRIAGGHAYQLRRDRIGIGDINNSLKEYGQSRLSDLYKEHRHQCAEVEILVETFAGGPAQFTTDQLLERMRTNIIAKYGMPALDGISILPRELAVAHFLFRIGFVNARDENIDDGPLGFIRFEDRPHLLSSNQNRDDGLPWEIHPSYRTVLRIGDVRPQEPRSSAQKPGVRRRLPKRK